MCVRILVYQWGVMVTIWMLQFLQSRKQGLRLKEWERDFVRLRDKEKVKIFLEIVGKKELRM